MSTRSPLVFLSIVIALAGVQAGTPCGHDQKSMTQMIEPTENGYFGPLWIPVNRAFDEAGALNRALTGETGARAIEARALRLENLSRAELREFDKAAIKRIGESPAFTEIRCPIVSTFPSRLPEVKGHESLRDIATNAVDLLIGRVTEIEPGFSLSMAGVMLHVDVADSVKKSARYVGIEEVLVFYPHASFAVGGRIFCSQGWFGAVAPVVDDRLLITPFGPSNASGTQVIHPRWWELPVLERGGILHVPDTLKVNTAFRVDQTLNDLVVKLTAVQAGSRPKAQSCLDPVRRLRASFRTRRPYPPARNRQQKTGRE